MKGTERTNTQDKEGNFELGGRDPPGCPQLFPSGSGVSTSVGPSVTSRELRKRSPTQGGRVGSDERRRLWGQMVTGRFEDLGSPRDTW